MANLKLRVREILCFHSERGCEKSEVHKDCSKKCENLSSELQLAKAQLEKLKISCGRTFCNPDGTQVLSCSKLPTSPKLGNCDCPNKSGPPSTDMYETEMMNQFNGAQRHDPQMLLDHIKEEHPHLVKRVHPKLPLSALKIGSNYQEDNDQEANAGSCIGKMGCGLRSRSGSGSRGSSSTRSPRQSHNGKRKMVYKSTSSSKKQKGGAIREATSNLKHTVAVEQISCQHNVTTSIAILVMRDKAPKQVKIGIP